MSKKQWIWLAVALVVFIAIGVFTAQSTNKAADSIKSLQTAFTVMEPASTSRAPS